MSDFEFYLPVFGSFALAVASALAFWVVARLIKGRKKPDAPTPEKKP